MTKGYKPCVVAPFKFEMATTTELSDKWYQRMTHFDDMQLTNSNCMYKKRA